MDKKTIVGIDLGTTNSVVSIFDDKQPKTLKIDNTKLLPSAVSFINGTFIVGQTAKNMAIVEPENTCLSIKRRMGEDIDIKLGKHILRPEDISSLILKKIKETVENKTGITVDKLRAVVTVPAYFTEVQREATKQAAEMANIKVERIINEPTAAALSFGLNKIDDAIFAIYDLGGGTYDISIVENNMGIVEVKASNGDNKLGGDDFDELFADHIWKKFADKNKIKEKPSAKEKARLLKIAEQTKISLSTENTVEIQENFFYKIKEKAIHLELTVTRDEFENLIKHLVSKTVSLLQVALEDADVEIDDIEGVILVGGSSRIPLVSKMIEEDFGIIPSLIDLPDEAVSHGATIQGAIINNIDIDTVLVDITPHSLGIKAYDGGSDESMEETMMQKMMGLDFEINAKTTVIIPKNTPIPVKRSRQYFGSVPFQKGFEIQIYQGEEISPSQNKLIGETLFEVKQPVERPTLLVTFELDINGILKMSAIQEENGEQVQATFKSSRGLKKRKSKVEDPIATVSESNKMLINRAEKVLKTDIDPEDKEELTELLEKYKTATVENSNNISSSENELLDLLFFLEQ